MTTETEMSLYVLILAVPLGLQLVQRVSPLLHTPLMSLTNAISAIAVVASTINIVSGFLITDRMLKMFRKKDK
jgi:NAD(P) transhydrogenase subunit alpha